MTLQDDLIEAILLVSEGGVLCPVEGCYYVVPNNYTAHVHATTDCAEVFIRLHEDEQDHLPALASTARRISLLMAVPEGEEATFNLTGDSLGELTTALNQRMMQLETSHVATLDEQTDTFLRLLGYPAVSDLLKKIPEEAAEAQENPSLEEMADVLITARVANAALGRTWGQLMTAMDSKMARNLERTWEQQEDGSYHHV